MATYYLNSAAAGANNGTSKTDAWTTRAAAHAGGIVAGDTVYIAHTHSETTAATTTYTNPTTPGIKWLVVDFGGSSPPVAADLTTGAVLAVSGSSTLGITGNSYEYGITYRGSTDSAAPAYVKVGDNTVVANLAFQSCRFETRTALSDRHIQLPLNAGANYRNSIVIRDSVFKFGNTGQSINLGPAYLLLSGISLDGSGSAPSTLCLQQLYSPGATFENSDLSVGGSTALINVSTATSAAILFRRCKVRSSQTLVTGTRAGIGGPVVRMHDCNNGDFHVGLEESHPTGTLVQQTGTRILTGGNTVEGVPWSLLMVGNTLSSYIHPLYSPEMAIAPAAVGSALTLTVEVLIDRSAALTDAEIGLEVSYKGTSGIPQGSTVTDRIATILTTVANQTTSSATWDTTGMSNPQTRKLEVTFTPAEVGYYFLRVVLMANISVYVSPPSPAV